MTTRKRLAVSYSRFSCPLQAKGDSEGRQDRDFRAFCLRHDLTPVKEVFIDRGRSGYHGEHRRKGRLGQLIDAARDGRFEPGTVVVVEAWDRLGRMRPDQQTKLIGELLETGVQIGVCRLDDIFSEDDFGTHKWTTLAVFVQLAFQESKQKAERIGASWAMRRERARSTGALLTSRVPAWMEVVNGQARLIPERAATVRHIFGLAAQGYGYARIAKALTEGGHRPFGKAVVREGRTRPQFSGKWMRPYIALILNDRRAVGEFQPMKDDRPEGEPIKGFYEAAVSEDEWLLARAGQTGRDSRTGAATRQAKYVNVFKGLLTHARDGEGYMLHNKGTRGAAQLLLVNATGSGGRGACYTFPYGVFEEAVLGMLREVDARDVLPAEKGEGPDRLSVLRARLADVRSQISQLQAGLKEGYSKALAAVLREQEAKEEAVAQELQEELARSVRPAAREWKRLPSLVDVLRETPDPDAARLKLRAVLRSAVETIMVLTVRRGRTTLAAVQVWFAGGEAHRDYLILYQAAGNHCPMRWWARSLADVAAPGKLDLRNTDHAKRLEKVLSAIDLDDQPADGP